MTRLFARVAILVAALTITLPSAARSAGSDPSDRPRHRAGTTGTCRVRDTSTGIETIGDGANLQDAIDAAAKGTTLVIAGRCDGNVSIPGAARIELRGAPTPSFPDPALNGGGSGTVLLNEGVAVVRGLLIKNGDARFGGGIYNAGWLALDGRARVAGNHARTGGGVFNEGTFVLRGRASVRANRAKEGGGIYEYGGRLLLKERSSVRGNRARYGGGGIAVQFDDVILAGSTSVRGNVADLGGGILGSGYMGNLLSLRDQASVTFNTARDKGGGIWMPKGGGSVLVCSPDVALSPNDPDDPPVVACTRRP